MCVYVCVCGYVCMYLCLQVCVYVFVYECMRIYKCRCMYVWVCGCGCEGVYTQAIGCDPIFVTFAECGYRLHLDILSDFGKLTVQKSGCTFQFSLFVVLKETSLQR